MGMATTPRASDKKKRKTQITLGSRYVIRCKTYSVCLFVSLFVCLFEGTGAARGWTKRCHEAQVNDSPVTVEVERRLNEMGVVVHAVTDVSDPVPVYGVAASVHLGRVALDRVAHSVADAEAVKEKIVALAHCAVRARRGHVTLVAVFGASDGRYAGRRRGRRRGR